MHFTRRSTYETGGQVPVITRGEGACIWDDAGRRYLDGLAGLLTVQVGHGREELADAAAAQASELAYFPLWSYARPRAIELADRLAGYTPGDLNRVFFTTGGGEAVESAWKLAKQHWKLVGKPTRHKVISRSVAYHGTPQGALSITGIPAAKEVFEPLAPGAFKVPNAKASTPMSATRRRRSGPPWRDCSTCRSSATSAARASSTGSSWSRTRPPGRPSTRTRATDRAPPSVGYPTVGYPTVGYPTVGYPTVGYPTVGYPSVGYLTAGLPDRRLPDRGALDALLDTALVAHVAVLEDSDGRRPARPYVIPVGFVRDHAQVLVRGSTASRAFRTLAVGRPTCLTATLPDTGRAVIRCTP